MFDGRKICWPRCYVAQRVPVFNSLSHCLRLIGQYSSVGCLLCAGFNCTYGVIDENTDRVVDISYCFPKEV